MRAVLLLAALALSACHSNDSNQSSNEPETVNINENLAGDDQNNNSDKDVAPLYQHCGTPAFAHRLMKRHDMIEISQKDTEEGVVHHYESMTTNFTMDLVEVPSGELCLLHIAGSK